MSGGTQHRALSCYKIEEIAKGETNPQPVAITVARSCSTKISFLLRIESVTTAI